MIKLGTLQRFVLALPFVFMAEMTLSVGPAASNDQLQIIYHERPPYYTTRPDGSVTGLVMDPILRSFENAGIPVSWRLVPAKHHLKILKDNNAKICAAGWFKNPEREVFAKFSDDIYQDKPMVALVKADHVSARKHASAETLLADPELKMGIKSGYSYGPEIDKLAKDRGRPAVVSSQSNAGLLRMLDARRFDFLFFPGDEVASIFKEVGELSERLAVVHLVDIPEGNKRYLLCSLKVSDSIIARFNAALGGLKNE